MFSRNCSFIVTSRNHTYRSMRPAQILMHAPQCSVEFEQCSRKCAKHESLESHRHHEHALRPHLVIRNDGTSYFWYVRLCLVGSKNNLKRMREPSWFRLILGLFEHGESHALAVPIVFLSLQKSFRKSISLFLEVGRKYASTFIVSLLRRPAKIALPGSYSECPSLTHVSRWNRKLQGYLVSFLEEFNTIVSLFRFCA